VVRGFRYRVIHPFDRSVVLRRFHLVYDKTVFYLYEDMIYRAQEDKIQNAFVRWGVILGVLAVLFVVAFQLFLGFPSRFQEVASRGLSSGGSVGRGQALGNVSGGISVRYKGMIKEASLGGGSAGGGSAGGGIVTFSFCFDEAGRYYGISPDLLRAIAQVESGINPKAYRGNSDGSASIGLMQVNTKWLSALRDAGYDESLFWNECYNIWLGAWVLRSCVDKYGYGWRAVECYRGLSNPKGNSPYVWAVYQVLVQANGNSDKGVDFSVRMDYNNLKSHLGGFSHERREGINSSPFSNLAK
jgi:hypothetical protein